MKNCPMCDAALTEPEGGFSHCSNGCDVSYLSKRESWYMRFGEYGNKDVLEKIKLAYKILNNLIKKDGTYSLDMEVWFDGMPEVRSSDD